MTRAIKGAAAAALALSVGACGHNPMSTYSWGSRHYANLSERDCMARAMYFESNRSSEEGMKAVGTVVMNRVKSGQYSSNICNVVGAPRQFAPGVLSKPVTGASWALAQRSADAVLAGERHARVGRAMHFHTAGYTFPYRNMAYVVAAGGNVFYEKKTPGTFNPVHPNILVAEAAQRPAARSSAPIVLARAEEPAPRVQLASLEEREAPRVMAQSPAKTPLRHAQPDEDMPQIGARHRQIAREAEEGPRQQPRSERVQLARLEDRELPRASGKHDRLRSTERHAGRDENTPPPRMGAARRQLAQQVEDAPRKRANPERIRLAHLDEDDMPKSLRQRSDATPSGRLGGIVLPYKGAAAEPVRAQGQKPQAMALAAKPAAPNAAPSRSGAKPEPAAKMPSATAKPRGEALPYRDAKAKPDALAKTGWHRGPEPAVKSASDKPKKRS